MWKKKEAKKEEKVEVKEEESVLKELCGDDAQLYDFLTNHLVVDPAAGISEESLDILTEAGEKSGNFTQALDKAIFEGAQNAEEREKYIKVIQNLASKAIHAMELEKEKAEKEGLADRTVSLVRKIEKQKFMIERAEDIINVASKFYNEKLLELEENVKREARAVARRNTEMEEQRIGETEKASRETRKKERSKMGGEERKEAERQDKIEELAAEERKEARAAARRNTEIDEQRIGETEKVDRDARKNERLGNK